MKRYLSYIFGIIITDLCLFPVSLAAFPAANFKMILAAIGLFLFLAKKMSKQDPSISMTLLGLTVISCFISFAGFFSTVINDTSDYVLAIYVVSMLVWYFSAYAVIQCLYLIHKKVDLVIVGNYLIAVCVAQCIIALLIENVSAIGQFVDNNFYSDLIDVPKLRLMKRIYGIGCALDVAGIRFSCVEIILVYIVFKRATTIQTKESIAYWISFIIILVIGSMIARTTTVGAIAAMLFFVVCLGKRFGIETPKALFFSFIILILLGCFAVIWLKSNPNNIKNLNQHLEFAFEGFYNYYRTGSFETHSTNILQSMYRWPENLKTWLYGDGLWDVDGHFYMFTDVGYIRFLFYFGLPGLLSFISLYIFATIEGRRLFPEDKVVFILLFIINMVVWAKVSTDTFVVFAILLNAGEMMSAKSQSIKEGYNYAV